MSRIKAFWLGLIGSALFLVIFVVMFVEFGQLVDILGSANYVYVIPSLVFYVLALWFRTVRWRFLLKPVMKGETQRALFPVVVVGYMANNLIPVRIGEFVRAYHLSLRERISMSAGVGTVALERLADMVSLLLLLGSAVSVGFVGFGSFVGELANDVMGGLPILILIAILPFIGVLVLLILTYFIIRSSSENIETTFRSSLQFLPDRFQDRSVRVMINLLSGLTVVRSPKAFLNVIALSLLVWVCEICMYYLIALGFDIRSSFGSELQFIAAIAVFGSAANLAGVFPSSAGSWGPFDAFGAAALVALGLDSSVAAAYALTVHVVLWAPVTIAGIALLLADSTSLERLVKGARNIKTEGDISGVDVNSSKSSVEVQP